MTSPTFEYDFCEPYFFNLPALCGENVLTATESEQTLESPSFDSSTMKNEVTCAWHIKVSCVYVGQYPVRLSQNK